MAHRTSIGYNARESGVVECVQFHHGVKETDACVDLAKEDRYGKGPGVFKPMDTDIWQPHVQCTSYSSYILDERWLRSEEHTSELQSRGHLVCRHLLAKKDHQT